jgi:class 3 adenylate cyclase
MANQGDQPGAETLERKLATIVSADVAEFSRLMAENEEETLRIFRSHRKVFESLVGMHRGRVFNTAGDAILAEFSSAVEAVRCATDIQAALRTANDQLPPNRQVRFRIGINLGDVMIHGQDLLGDGVNVAARLQTAAEPGGICISGSVHDQIVNKLSLSFHSLGEMNFKNIQRPVRTFSISEVEGGIALPSRNPSGGNNKRSWLAALAILLLAAGFGFYFFSRNKAAPLPATAPEANAARPKPVEVPQMVQNAEPKPADTAAAVSVSPPTKTLPEKPPKKKAVQSVVAEAKPQPPVPDRAAEKETKSTAETGDAPPLNPARFNGVYSGSICYAETKKEPLHCYHAQGNIRDAIISGEWFMGPAKKVRSTMAGRVLRSGGVRIQIETRNIDDDTKLATITLAGALKGGLIDASGSFRNGRPVTLNWHKNPESAH